MKRTYLLLLSLSAVWAQPLRGVLGIFEGNGTTYPNTGLFYYLSSANGSSEAFAGPIQDVEPFGNDLAYDPATQLLFVIGGSRGAFTPWRGSVYALDVWRSSVPLSILDSIGARRLAVRDTLLLVTRSRAPYFTAYRIQYNPQTQTLRLDSLWSPSSPLLRSVPDGLLVWGDTAYIALSYDASYSPDSLVLAIDLRTRAVARSWEVFPNPAELVRVGSSIYAACYGNFSQNLRIAKITPGSSTVTIWDAGHGSFGGFATDTGGVKDTILFWDITHTLRAFAVGAQQTAPGAYAGVASSGGGLSGYGLLWTGAWLWTSFTNYIDTSLIILRDAAPSGGAPGPRIDTIFRPNGIPGGIGYPSLRRFVYFEGDTSRSVSALSAPRGQLFSVWPNPVTDWLSWSSVGAVERFTLWSVEGRKLREWLQPKAPLYVADLPAGTYFLRVHLADGRSTTVPIVRP